MRARTLSLALCLAPLASPAFAEGDVVKSEKADFRVETVASGLDHPWSLAFLPDGRMLVTERPGRLRISTRTGNCRRRSKACPPSPRSARAACSTSCWRPISRKSRIVYFSFAEPRGPAGAVNPNSTSLASARFLEEEGKAKLADVKVIFRQEPADRGRPAFRLAHRHRARRHAVPDDGRAQSQEPGAGSLRHLGKVIRIHADGSVPPDNPFVGRKDAKPEIWSYGHRNIQARGDPSDDRQALDRRARAEGRRRDQRAGDGQELRLAGDRLRRRLFRRQDPREHRTRTAWSSRSITGCRRSRRPAWPSTPATRFPAGRAISSSARSSLTHLERLELDGEKIVKEERLLRDLGLRIRDVRQAPDGTLWLLTDARDGKVLHIVPAK